MNRTVSKLLRKHCAKLGYNYRHAKRAWTRTPWNKRHEAREQMLEMERHSSGLGRN